jgi:regulator of protease activity HflC (stomatin/prohibitin superfamily)
LESRSTIDAFLLERCAPEIKEFGIELNYATIRDITFPGELKKVFAQSVAARKEGLAALERARGETAALRNLANAAALIRDNPALLQLRAIQAVSEGSGATLVLGAPFSEAIVRPKPPAS